MQYALLSGELLDIYTMDRPKFIVSNQKEESICVERVKFLT